MRDYKHGIPQAMVFPETHHISELRGKPKGVEVILLERILWPDSGYRSDGRKFLLQCPTAQDQPGCRPDLAGGCCARTLMASQRDFGSRKVREQKGSGAERFGSRKVREQKGSGAERSGSRKVN